MSCTFVDIGEDEKLGRSVGGGVDEGVRSAREVR